MMNKYYQLNIKDRSALDQIVVGDLIRVNDWKRGMRVKAVSENFFVMSDGLYYSVFDKRPRQQGNHNNMKKGKFHCGKDSWIFGSPLSLKYSDFYKFNDPVANQKYLDEFENGKAWVSERSGVSVDQVYCKKN